MTKFRFTLDALARLRANARDRCRVELADACTRQQDLHARQQAIQAESKQLKQSFQASAGTLDPVRLMEAHCYQAALKRQWCLLEEQCIAVDGELITRREALTNADRELRALEKLRERQFARHVAQGRKAEANRLDEFTQGTGQA